MKTIAVIGLGKFGYYIAKSLSRLEDKVIAIDTNEKKVQEISEYIEDAYILDSTNKNALEDAGIVNLHTVIVSIGENLEASILTVMALKDLGNENIIAKAISTTHGEILAKLGVSRVVHPEKVAGRVLLHNLVENMSVEKMDLSNSMRIIKFKAPESMLGVSLNELNKLEPQIKIIALKKAELWSIELDFTYRIKRGDTLACLGDSRTIEKFYEHISK